MGYAVFALNAIIVYTTTWYAAFMLKQIFVTSDGRKRKGISTKCLTCAVKFLTRLDKPAKYCSTACYRIGSKKQVRLECAWCRTVFERARARATKSKSKLYFCCRACKDNAQMLGGIDAIMPPHFGRGNGQYSYRRTYKRIFHVRQLQCHRCGYREFECGVDIHHSDNNRKNNTGENLVALCAPCHRALHCGLWKL